MVGMSSESHGFGANNEEALCFYGIGIKYGAVAYEVVRDSIKIYKGDLRPMEYGDGRWLGGGVLNFDSFNCGNGKKRPRVRKRRVRPVGLAQKGKLDFQELALYIRHTHIIFEIKDPIGIGIGKDKRIVGIRWKFGRNHDIRVVSSVYEGTDRINVSARDAICFPMDRYKPIGREVGGGDEDGVAGGLVCGGNAIGGWDGRFFGRLACLVSVELWLNRVPQPDTEDDEYQKHDEKLFHVT